MSISFLKQNHSLEIIFDTELNQQNPAIILNALPIGINGKQATTWAATLSVTLEKFNAINPINTEHDTGFSADMLIFPNPANGIITFSVKHNAGIYDAPELTIYDIGGRRIKILRAQAKQSQLKYSLNTDFLASGIYISHINLNGREIVKKFSVIR
jgi:hypothetical protein